MGKRWFNGLFAKANRDERVRNGAASIGYPTKRVGLRTVN